MKWHVLIVVVEQGVSLGELQIREESIGCHSRGILKSSGRSLQGKIF